MIRLLIKLHIREQHRCYFFQSCLPLTTCLSGLPPPAAKFGSFHNLSDWLWKLFV